MTTATAAVSIGPAVDGDTDAIQAFFGEVYGAGYVLAVDAPLFRWQFLGPGASAAPHLLLARRGGRIVAALGYIPVEVTLDGATCAGAWTCNWISRRDEPFPAGPCLMRELTRRHPATLALGLSRDARALLPRLGFRSQRVLQRFVRVLDAEGARTLAPTGSEPADVQVNAPGSAVTSRVRQVSTVAEDVADAWSAMAATGTRRSVEYLTWRYLAHPRFRYEVWEMRDRRLRAMAVARTERARGLATAVRHIVDVVGQPEAVADLADVIAMDASHAGVAVVDLCVSGAGLGDALARRGWCEASTPALAWLPRRLQPVDHRSSDVHFMAFVSGRHGGQPETNWHLTLGDGDQDRPN